MAWKYFLMVLSNQILKADFLSLYLLPKACGRLPSETVLCTPSGSHVRIVSVLKSFRPIQVSTLPPERFCLKFLCMLTSLLICFVVYLFCF